MKGNTNEYLISISNMLRYTFSDDWIITFEPAKARLILRHKGDKRKQCVLVLAYDESPKRWYVTDRSTFCVGQAIHILNTAVQVAEIRMNVYNKGDD